MKLRNLLFFFFAYLGKVLTQEDTPAETPKQHKTLKIDVEDIGKIEEDMGLVYYKLTVPVHDNNSNLALRVKENESADRGEEEFSDPDIYVSKTNSFPTNPQNAKWYSERYGEDLVSIPKSEVNEGDVFYIGVYCEKKCKFEILAKLEPEYEVEERTIYHVNLSKENSISYRFAVRDADYEELEIVAFSDQIGYFRIYVGMNELPSPQKTIQAIPSWVGGYSVNIYPGTPTYCKNCYYYIVLEAPVYDVSVSFFIQYPETVTTVNSAQPVFSTLKPFKTHCYKIFVDDKTKKENLIIQTELFSGSAQLFIRPWGIPSIIGSVDLNTTEVHNIHSEKVVKFSPEKRAQLGDGSEVGNVNFCLKTSEYTSYIIRAFFESEVEKTQKFSYLYRGKELNGYLPAGKAMRYRVVEFDANSDINISLNKKTGDPKLYGYVCENIRDCKFTKDKVESLLSANKLILPLNYSFTQLVSIPNSINTCHKQLEKEDSLKNSANNIPCAVLAVVLCEGTEECEYSIRTTRETISIQLKPRKIHYQVIPFNDTDSYNIVVEDDNVESINVVLNSITGDADLSVYYWDENEVKLVAVSENEPYLPDVVKITKAKMGKSLVGKFMVRVYGSSFSSYSLYYYYTKTNVTETPDANKADITVDPSLISLELQTGHIIRDFFDEETTYKVYAYNVNYKNNLDIRITLTPEQSQFGIFVFFNPNEIVYDPQNSFEQIKNAKWSSIYNNELIIRKDDKDYQKEAVYYIVITKLTEGIFNPLKKSTHKPSFWLGVTNEIYPFLLYEGVPQMSTLDSNYNNQTYWYTHPNISEPFSLSINVFYGRVSVFADFEEIRDFSKADFPIKALDTDTGLMKISSERLKSGCKQMNNCGIYIYVNKSSLYDAQYLLVAKSHKNRPEMLTSGVIRSDSMSPGEVKKYNFVVEKKKNTMVFISFLSGYGDVYLNVPKEFQSARKAEYPTSEKFDYKANDFYLGKIVNLNDKAFEDCDHCQILVSVYGGNLGFEEDQIEYTISYYDQARKINQNQPLRGYITQGEIQYFNVYFGQKADNVYVSLTNMDGDADLYMNYGLSFPSFDNSTWSSNTPYNEFIDFNKDDNFFITNKIADASGNYTIMLFGYTNTTYTLYITSHPKKILPVGTSSPASCRAKASESCYFLFDDFADANKMTEKDSYDFIITTDYLYGSGVIYASLYSETNYEIIDKFPSEGFNDFSSVYANSRNLLKFKIEKLNQKLTKDSMLLVTVECKENCFLDLNMMKMFDSDVQYLDLYRENVFYIYKKADNKKTILLYYNWKDKDLNYYIYTYEGKANFNIYTNATVYNNKTAMLEYQTTDINSFSVDYARNSTYHNKILNKDFDISYGSIYFGVEPLTDVGFHVKLSYDLEWTKIKVGKVNNVLLNLNNGSRRFFGYFDMLEDYEYVVVTVTSKDPNVVVYVYARYVYINKKEKSQDKENPYGYIIPDNTNAEITGNTDPILNSVSVKVNRPALDNLKGKHVRVLMTIDLLDLSVLRDNFNVELELMVSPSTSGMSKVQAEQAVYTFSQFQGLNTDVKIYDLKRRMPEDDLLIVEISSCIGDVDFKITEKMNFNKNDIHSIDHTEDTSSGRKLVKVDLKKYTGDNFYLTLFAKSAGQKDCYIKDGVYTCDDNVISMFYYYTTTELEYKNSFANGRGSIVINNVESDNVSIKWNKILTTDGNKQVSVARSNYTLFVTDNLFDFNHMESVCYLSKMKMNSTKVIDIQDKEDGVYASINGLKADKRYFINVLAKNLDTNEVLAFIPIEVIPKAGRISAFYIVVVVVTLLVLLFLVFYFYRRYRITREILKYEVNDVRNLSNIPRSESELKDLAKASSVQKYANLTSEISAV